jgi:hypothetical protein
MLGLNFIMLDAREKPRQTFRSVWDQFNEEYSFALMN